MTNSLCANRMHTVEWIHGPVSLLLFCDPLSTIDVNANAARDDDDDDDDDDYDDDYDDDDDEKFPPANIKPASLLSLVIPHGCCFRSRSFFTFIANTKIPLTVSTFEKNDMMYTSGVLLRMDIPLLYWEK